MLQLIYLIKHADNGDYIVKDYVGWFCMGGLFALGLAPVLIGLVYIYIRDKYESEPWRLLVIGVLVGAGLTAPIIWASTWLMRFLPVVGQVGEAFFTAFAVSSLVEEGLKFAALVILVWRNPNLNEPMDGIVYGVFISLGFAGVENILYIFNPQLGGMETAIARALVSVPSHGFFGIAMGYYFALAKFEPRRRARHMAAAFVSPYIIHGVYNFLLLSGQAIFLIIFVPFIYIFWRKGLAQIRAHLEISPFK